MNTKNLQLFLAVFIWLLCFESQATNYFVRTTGNNNNTGLANTDAEAWATLSYSLTKIKAGDKLYIADGLYKTNKINILNLDATPENPTIIKAINRWGAKIAFSTSSQYDNLIEITSCEHLVFDGFEIYDSGNGKGSGIDIRQNSHHITVSNCYVHDCGCGGISSRVSDYLTIEKNVVRDNAKRSEWNCSGISIWHPVESDKNEGYHMIIRQNVAFENECTLPFSPQGYTTPTDGNGIIVDDYYNTQGGGQEGGYQSATLIENNLSFNNGGRGIMVFKSDKVTVRNNTLWHNMYVLSQYGKYTGDLEFFESRHSDVYNNITVQHPDYQSQAFRMYEASASAMVCNNLVVGIKDFWPVQPTQKGNVIRSKTDQTYSKFLNATTNVAFDSLASFYNYFGLSNGSPAINAATTENFSMTDLLGVDRISQGSKPDLGCFEKTVSTSTMEIPANGCSFEFYPNPAKKEITIKGGTDYSLKFFNNLGQLLLVKKGLNGLVKIDLPKTKPGIYLINYNEGQKQITKKLIIY